MGRCAHQGGLDTRWASPLEAWQTSEADLNCEEEEESWEEDGEERGMRDDAANLKRLFVCSVVGRSKTKTLHKVGECHRLPGIHYRTFEVLGEEFPAQARTIRPVQFVSLTIAS